MSLAVDAVSGAAPVGLRVALLVVLAGGGLAVGLTGWLGWQGRLGRNRFAGVRTPATLRDDRTFEVANRVAGPPVTAAGAVMVLAGLAAFVLPGLAGTVVAAAVGAVGALVFAGAGGVLGHRVAAAMPVPAPERPAGCGGCACGAGGCGAS